MPLVQNNQLPTYQKLMDEGRLVLQEGRALNQDIRELHIGLLNIMPDAAVEATERQFFRLVGESNRIAQIYMHPFTVPIVERSAEMNKHFDQYYESWEDIKTDGLDALIITGANEETNPHVSDAEFWGALKDVLDWAYENVTSTLCSCLASHAAMQYSYNIGPSWRNEKRWGVFQHRVTDRKHPLVRGMNTVLDAPHSRYSEITPEQFKKAGMNILVQNEAEGIVHMATSPDGFRVVCFQGHPEYDTFSLLKEYKREVQNFQDGARNDYPPFPENYFSQDIQQLLEKHRNTVLQGTVDNFPEKIITDMLENTWADSARTMLANWIGLVYQVTHVKRQKQFMDGVDPNNPLGL